MISATSDEFLTNRAWHRAVLSGEDVILRHTSALEHLELFLGYMREKICQTVIFIATFLISLDTLREYEYNYRVALRPCNGGLR